MTTKRPVGRPARGYPPRIAATPDEIARVMLTTLAPKEAAAKTYRCAACGVAVYYPATLYRDGRCEECHAS